MIALAALIGLLALANPTLAIPQLGKPGLTPHGTTSITVAGPNTTKTPASTSTGVISIPDSVIEAAAIVDLPPKNPSLKSISGAPLSGVLAARPDLVQSIDAQPSIAQSLGSNATLSKRGGVTLGDPGDDCVNNGGKGISVANWVLAAKKVCNHWFPDHTQAPYVPSGSGFAATLSIGFGAGITLTFEYGVTDLGSGFLFYEPFSYDICLADLTALIQGMDSDSPCVFDDGINLGFDPLNWVDTVPFGPSLKYYGFHD